jgi:hypothetical protein
VNMLHHKIQKIESLIEYEHSRLRLRIYAGITMICCIVYYSGWSRLESIHHLFGYIPFLTTLDHSRDSDGCNCRDCVVFDSNLVHWYNIVMYIRYNWLHQEITAILTT